MNYIGIRGHRGAGKSSIAFLLGQTIDTLLRFPNLSSTSFEEMYDKWCKELLDNPIEAYNNVENRHIIYESFSDSIMVFIRLLLGCPDEYTDDAHKDSIVVNVKDLTYMDRDEFDGNLITAKEMYNSIDTESHPQAITKKSWMTMGEFIIYFGMEVMQRFFGKNVWVNTVKASSNEFDQWHDQVSFNYKIFNDIKTEVEAHFIRDMGGVIVKVVRPTNKKGKSSLESLCKDDNFYYIIEVNGDLQSTIYNVIDLAQNIIKKYENE